jgi:hypothetical protein
MSITPTRSRRPNPPTSVTREPRVIAANHDSEKRHRLYVSGAFALAAALALTAFAGSRANAQDWQISEVGAGTKPALGLTPDGDPVVIYMLERIEGWVRIATLADGDWAVDEIDTGYFYGPPDIAVDADGIGHATYHDHQDSSFRPEKGDALYVQGVLGDWDVSIAADQGHDGWDNRITLDSTGKPHMVAIDPLEFNGSGIEYYGLGDDGTWSIEQIGSGPQTYKYATSIAVAPDGTPWITYHDGTSGTLRLAQRTADGWTIETVDDRGRTGLFSEITIDGDGGQHISYLEQTGESTGTVRYGFRADPGSDWQLSDVDTLEAMFYGFTGARNITSIDLDSNGQPWIAYSDEAVMKLAQPGNSDSQIETVAESAPDAPFGQILSLELDGADAPHIAFATVSSKQPLDGTISYATRGEGS